MRRLVALVLGTWSVLSCASSTACPFETVAPPPGELSMGFYTINAYALAPTDAGARCELDDVTEADFAFDIALSQNPDAGETFMTMEQGYSRAATWDGQVVRSTESARRYFEQCSECVTRVEETIELALLSASQAAAAGNTCPANPLDGGVPAANDAGVFPPGPRAMGFDALLACGALNTQVVVDEGLPDGGPCPSICSSCRTSYVLQGARR
ncbi:MAG: hypothetical protein AB1938_20740 [Myxococcota bacterium]